MEHLHIMELVAQLAAKSKLTEAQVKVLLQAQAEVAYENARKRLTVPIPGIGVLAVTERPEREMVMQFGPQKGNVVKVPASARVKVNVKRMAVNAIFGPIAPAPNVFHLKAWAADDESPDGDEAADAE
jgi:nucleoid DNA-binding protein